MQSTKWQIFSYGVRLKKELVSSKPVEKGVNVWIVSMKWAWNLNTPTYNEQTIMGLIFWFFIFKVEYYIKNRGIAFGVENFVSVTDPQTDFNELRS